MHLNISFIVQNNHIIEFIGCQELLYLTHGGYDSGTGRNALTGCGKLPANVIAHLSELISDFREMGRQDIGAGIRYAERNSGKGT